MFDIERTLYATARSRAFLHLSAASTWASLAGYFRSTTLIVSVELSVAYG